MHLHVGPALLVVAALTLAACGGDDAGAGGGGDGPAVVVTTSVLGALADEVAGDTAAVEVLMGSGADPHAFSASARQAVAMREADLLVVNGGALEAGLLGVVDAAADDGVRVFTALDAVDPIPFGGDDHDGDDHDDDPDGDDDDGDDHEGADPHFWQDPVRTAEVVVALGEALAEIDPDGATGYRDRAATFAHQVRALDAEIEALVAEVPEDRRRLVTNHEAFAYLADRYGFEVVGVVVPGGDTLASPSPSDLVALADAIEREGVPALFAENTRPTRLAQALAAEVGRDVEVVQLYSDALGADGSGAETYVGMIRTNAERITTALAAP